MSKTRFQETFLDFAAESIREDNYRGVDIRVTDPYGYWIADGVDGYFTTRDLVEQAVDAYLHKQALEPTEKAVQAPAKVTKQVVKASKASPSVAS